MTRGPYTEDMVPHRLRQASAEKPQMATELVSEAAPQHPVAVLTGPSTRDVARGLPTASLADHSEASQTHCRLISYRRSVSISQMMCAVPIGGAVNVLQLRAAGLSGAWSEPSALPRLAR